MADFKLCYGASFKADAHPASVEKEFIKRGGLYVNSAGVRAGLGLFEHYRNLMSILWPEDDHHRWSDKILENLLENRITAVMGTRDSSKTRTMSKWVLCDYYCFPEETLTLMTSTNIRGLELRVWGDIKSLHERAQKVCAWLPGNVADAKHGIFTDRVGLRDEIRDMRKGIICVPCIGTQGEYLGDALRDFCGIKQKRRRLVGDELQFIPVEYLKVLDSLDKGDFKAGFLGNPIADNGKALDAVTEPVGGWSSAQGEITKTATWRNKYGGVTINLVGPDSPNFDPETLNKFPYLLDQKDMDRVSSRPGGKDSIEWWSQIMGVRKSGAISYRVLTVAEVEKFGGFGDCVWAGSDTIKIYSIDAGFGGDPCVRTYGEFGKDVAGNDVLLIAEQKVIPIHVSVGNPETQIARYAKADMDNLRVPYAHLYFDAGMYATLAIELARVLSPDVNAVNFSGTATQRPVANDTYVFDERTRERRLKTCYEHYSKFVTELWFAVRLLTLSGQLRHFPRAAAEEFGRREWRYVYDNRIELETKIEYKVRNGGESPNYGDSLVILVEGARRLGLMVRNMSEAKPDTEPDWLDEEREKYQRYLAKTELNYS